MQVGTDIWKLQAASTVAPTPVTVPTAASAYPLLSSGQLAILPFVEPASGVLDTSATLFPGTLSSAKAIDSVRTVVSTDSTSSDTHAHVATAVQFDMKTATFSMTRTSDSSSGSSDDLEITHDLCVLLHMPHVVMHRITIASISGSPLSEILRVEHEMSGSNDDTTLEFSGVLASTNGTQVYMSQATGDTTVCISGFRLPDSLTLVDLPEHGEPGTSGGGRRRARSTLLLQPDGAATTAEIVVYSSTHQSIAAAPAAAAAAAAKRNVLAAISLAPSVVYARHVGKWESKWQTSIDVPDGASERIRSALAYATYNLHAGATLFPGMNPAGWQGRGDDFVTPALLYVAPDAARLALEQRASARAQQVAKEAADLAALDGVRYPYGPLECRQAVVGGIGSSSSGSGSSSSRASTLDVPVHGLVRVHGTVMTGLNAWNYYRVSGDRAWLAKTGYPLVSSAADMVATLAVQNGDGVTYRMEGVVALTDTTVDATVKDAVLVIAGSIALLKAACEASYALGHEPRQIWLDVRFGLSLPNLAADKAGAPLVAPFPLARYDGEDLAADLASAAAARSGGMRLGQQAPEEVLLALAEPIGTMIEADLGFNIISNLSRNYAVWGGDADVSGAGGLVVPSSKDAVRHLIRLLATAQAMQVDATLTASFLASMDAFLDTHCDFESGTGGFGNLSREDDAVNDAELSALFLLVFISGLGGGMVQGGYGESGLEYATLGASLGTSAVMPDVWERLVLKGIGQVGVDAVLLNRGIVGTVGTGGGNAVVVGGGGGSVVFWSTDTLTL